MRSATLITIVLAFSSITLAGPQGTTYSVNHELASQTQQCFPIPTQPGGDDIVVFDGIPEQARTYFNGTVPIVVEQSVDNGTQTQITIQTHSSPPGLPLFPGGLNSPQGPLTGVCFKIGYQDPLDWNGDKHVVHAELRFTRGGATVAGPFDVTGPLYFANPWDGRFAFQLAGGAGPALNIDGVILFLVCEPNPPDCFTDPDCDDGDECTVDKCVNGVCTHKQLKDTLSREEALRASHGPNKDCFESGSYPIPLPGDPQPDDRWQTGDQCDATNQWRIGMTAGDPPIPADFFGPGSLPFTGAINFKGLPLGLPGMDEVDTIVRRSADPFLRSDPVSPTEVTVGIELVALNLVSCTPITVNYEGGSTTQWNVRTELSDCPPPAGTLTATKTHCNGGTFTSVLRVQPRVMFTRVENPADVRVLDTGCTAPPFPFDTLTPPTPIAWVHDISSKLLVVDNYASAFHAGLPDGMSDYCGDYDSDNDCDVDDFKAVLRSYQKVAGQPGYNPWIDYDVNGVVDKADYQQWLACYRCAVGNANASPPQPGTLGDLDGNGAVNARDIRQFVNCVMSGGGALGCVNADIDQDGDVDGDDVPGMVLLLLELN